ncbi:glycerate kinase [soil metagenome]
MQILIAPNAFKNSLDATNVAEAIANGLQRSKLKCTCTIFPVGDGGDGTGELLTRKLNGKTIRAPASNAMGHRLEATFGMIEQQRLAIIEMANASGLKMLDKNEIVPLHANSFGTGEQILQALNLGARKIIIALGGSATTDGATGILKALGVNFLDKKGNTLQHLPGDLPALNKIDMAGVDKRILDCEIIVLCDVENTLLGANGAAKIFATQKGATEKEVDKLEKGLTVLAKKIYELNGKEITNIKHGGTAGGTAAGLYGLLHAKLLNGIHYFLDITDFDHHLTSTDLVVTGEGSIDEQTLGGKGPFGVAKRARKLGLPVIGLAGKIPSKQNSELRKYFNELISINPENISVEEAIANTKTNLELTAYNLGNKLASKYRT